MRVTEPWNPLGRYFVRDIVDDLFEEREMSTSASSESGSVGQQPSVCESSGHRWIDMTCVDCGATFPVDEPSQAGDNTNPPPADERLREALEEAEGQFKAIRANLKYGSRDRVEASIGLAEYAAEEAREALVRGGP